jgi:D-methionine transport system substrate-binding protein
MKKIVSLFLAVSSLGLVGCNGTSGAKTITIAASEIPHAEVLNNAVKPILAAKGYTLKVTILDWTMQNDAVYNGEYDANYFQHRPYLQQYDSGSTTYSKDYTYTKVFPVASVHFEPLRIYPGMKTASEFESTKTTATYEICNDVSNELRALDLLVNAGVISSYETDKDGNPINLPSNIHPIDENLLVSSIKDYDYAVLPTNSALTGKLTADTSLPVETDSVKERNANVVAANVKKYKNDSTYKEKIDVLVDAVLSKDVSDFITKNYLGVISVAQEDLR